MVFELNIHFDRVLIEHCSAMLALLVLVTVLLVEGEVGAAGGGLCIYPPCQDVGGIGRGWGGG